jgi:hypothetical protein
MLPHSAFADYVRRGSICSCVRFVYLEGLLNYKEFFWSATNTAIWSTIEPGTGIIAISIATTRPLFRRVFRGRKDAVRLTSRALCSSKRGKQSGTFSLPSTKSRQSTNSKLCNKSKKGSIAHPKAPANSPTTERDFDIEAELINHPRLGTLHSDPQTPQRTFAPPVRRSSPYPWQTSAKEPHYRYELPSDVAYVSNLQVGSDDDLTIVGSPDFRSKAAPDSSEGSSHPFIVYRNSH